MITLYLNVQYNTLYVQTPDGGIEFASFSGVGWTKSLLRRKARLDVLYPKIFEYIGVI